MIASAAELGEKLGSEHAADLALVERTLAAARELTREALLGVPPRRAALRDCRGLPAALE